MDFFPPFLANNPIFLVIVLITSISLIWKSAGWLVDSSCNIAFRLSISPMVVGLTIVAIGTSAPEFAVSVGAALQGNTEIAVGNVFGSNIFNLGFILGIYAIFGNITTDRQSLYQSGGFLIFSVGLFYFLAFGFPNGKLNSGFLSLFSCIVMITILILYIFFLYWKKNSNLEIDIPPTLQKNNIWREIFYLLLGLIGIIISAHFLVESGSNLGRLAGLSDWVIGITIIAMGTSCPELVITIASLIKKKKSIAIGNLIGSDIFNILGAIGVAGIINQGIFLSPDIHFSLIILFFNLLLVVFFLRTSWKLSTWEGIILIIISFFRYWLDIF